MAVEITKHDHPVYDVHTHLSPEKIDMALQIMEISGVDKMVNLSGGTGDKLKANLEAAARHGDKFPQMANVDFDIVDDPKFGEKNAQMLAQAKKDGIVGLKIFKRLGLKIKLKSGKLLQCNDPEMDPIWEACGELGLYVLIHVGDPPDFWKDISPSNRFFKHLQKNPERHYGNQDVPKHADFMRMQEEIVRKHKGTTFLGAHLGGFPEDFDYIQKLFDECPNWILDISATVNWLGMQDPEQSRNFLTKNADRLYFGTDAGGNFKDEPPLEVVPRFYQKHYDFLETDRTDLIAPFSRDLVIKGAKVAKDVQEKIYHKNYEGLLESLKK